MGRWRVDRAPVEIVLTLSRGSLSGVTPRRWGLIVPTLVMALGGAGLLMVLPDTAPVGIPFMLSLPAVVVLSLLAELAAVRLPGSGMAHVLSMTEIGLVIGLSFAIPADVVAARVIAAAVVFAIVQRTEVPKTAFNMSLVMLETAAASVVFHAVIDSHTPVDRIGWLAAAAAVATTFLIGMTAAAAARRSMGVVTGRSDVQALITSLTVTGAGTLVGILGGAALWLETSAWLLVGAMGLTMLALLARGTRDQEPEVVAG